ncbi:MAG: radical SAM protein [Candidatus Omnitrophica bacterium]|nr:radical SAM protein [Candidatus Omnitrophota bacterium]
MGLRKKVSRLIRYYRENGLAETVKYYNDKRVQFIRNKYPFEYQCPKSITIEIMNTCNIRCQHCYLKAQINPAKKFMDYDFFEKIIQKTSALIKTVGDVNFASVEALFHPNFFDMVDLIQKVDKDARIHINTNGMLLDEDCIDKLLKRRIYTFSLSLDGCKKETVESFKSGVDFDKIIRNCKMLKEKGRNQVKIVANFVAHRSNINEIMDYIDFCNDLGVTAIGITGFISYDQKMTGDCLYSESGIMEVDELLRKAKDKAESVGIYLSHRETKLTPKGCPSLNIMYIDIEGNIVPCVNLSKNTRITLLDKTGITEQVIWGNVINGDARKVWMDKPSVNFRKSLYENKLPNECCLCAMGYGVIC